MWRQLKKNPLSLVGIGLIVFWLVVALLAPFLARPEANSRDPYLIPQESFAIDPQPPRKGYPFGTSEQSYDLFYGIVWGSRTAFKVGLTVVGISMIIGLAVGSVAGYYGRWIDEILMRFVDVILAFPSFVLAVVIVAILSPGLDKVMTALAAVSWPTYARLLRGEILTVKQQTYVEAARAIGAGTRRTLIRHILPNSIYPLIIVGSMSMGQVVITAAAFSFVGLGAPVGYADWGQLISLSRNWIIGSAGNPFGYWYTFFFPATAIFLFVLGWNLTGDAFRDILDPRMKR
ncbi:MAG: ABC transporter permease [Elusimicrobia bacterium]|nr:ABC transporter permease [Elusimicrobiota bacterium]